MFASRRRRINRAFASGKYGRVYQLVLEKLEDRTLLTGPSWLGYAHDPQHTALAPVASQNYDVIRWQTPVDLNPQYSGNDLFIHYGSPLITEANTVILPVKTGATGGFRVEAHSGIDGAVKWMVPTDYILPAHDWVPPYAPTLTPQNRLYFGGAGGTVYYLDNPDANGATTTGQLAFYGLANYDHSLDSRVFINTPLTSDAAGNIYFGFRVTGSNALNLVSGIARISADGTGTWVSATAAAADSNITEVVYNCAPALSMDGSTLYITVSNGNGLGNTSNTGYLLALNSTDLTTRNKVFLRDPRGTSGAYLSDFGTASPTVGPDGDVYIGVLENPFNRHDRGWFLHFSGDLTQTKTPGGFGWDDTASIVPASMVPSYHGTSTYLLMAKYNDYAEFSGGTGINKIAVIDPNDTQPDFITGTPVMKDVLTIAGVTPDPDFPDHPGAVREWCINSAAVDPFTRSIIANSEDGKVYRWDMATNTFTQVMTLAPPTGEAYTPTVVGPNGAVYAVNNATLFAIQAPAGPVILSQNPLTTPGSLGSLRVTFSRAIDPSTFTVDKVRSFIGPAGPVTVTNVTPVGGSGNQQFDITFPTQRALGNYTIVIGPDIRDTGNHPMDTNDNGIPGEDPADAYVGHFTIVGPKIVASTPANNLLAPVTKVTVTFNEPMDPATFTPDKIFDFFGPNGRIPVSSVTPVAGFNNTRFDINFDPQVNTGIYHMLIGPNIRDFAGHQMDQDGDFIEGEIPDDLYQAQFGLLGLRVTVAAPANAVDGPVYSTRFTFNEPVDPSTFTPDKVDSFTGPNGDININAVVPVPGSNNTQFDVLFDPQPIAGAYRMVIGPDIRDEFGNQMDQDQNFIPGEIPGDQFVAQFAVKGPRVTTATPPSDVFPGLDHIRVTFNKPMDPTTFTPDQIASFTGPGGPIPVTDVSVVPFTNNTQFDISFDPLGDLGAYSMVIGPYISDTYGNLMDQNQNGIPGEIPGDQYTAHFNVVSTTAGPDGFGYTATVTPFENHEILGLPGTFTIINYADDAAAAVDLGSNTFTFYGTTYTGNNRLFASSNGLITFGSGNSAHVNTNLTNSPTQAAIAPLWNDWIKTTGTPMLLGKFDAFDDNGVPHQLILEWNQVTHFGYTGALTFQVVLTLNTGTDPGDIVVDYSNLQSGDIWAEGNASTVGIKDAGTQGLRRLLLNFSARSPFVGTQQAILFSKTAASRPDKWSAVALAAPDTERSLAWAGSPGWLPPTTLTDAAAVPLATGDLKPIASLSAPALPLISSAGKKPASSALPDVMGLDDFFAWSWPIDLG
jgi:hypothetical protein